MFYYESTFLISEHWIVLLVLVVAPWINLEYTFRHVVFILKDLSCM
jgi:hypothetical protein